MPDETSLPDDIDELMKAFGVEPGKTPSPPLADSAETALPPASTDPVPEPVPAPTPAPAADTPPGQFSAPTPAARPEFQAFSEATDKGGEATLDMLKDVSLNVRVEVGRTKMYVQDILRLAAGSVVELERLTGDPLDIYVNDRLVARGEVLVINENFAIRITEVIHPDKPKD